eukprot:5694426-Amphidinium_carterae.1
MTEKTHQTCKGEKRDGALAKKALSTLSMRPLRTHLIGAVTSVTKSRRRYHAMPDCKRCMEEKDSSCQACRPLL